MSQIFVDRWVGDLIKVDLYIRATILKEPKMRTSLKEWLSKGPRRVPKAQGVRSGREAWGRLGPQKPENVWCLSVPFGTICCPVSSFSGMHLKFTRPI